MATAPAASGVMLETGRSWNLKAVMVQEFSMG
jgi:hypothetical protein